VALLNIGKMKNLPLGLVQAHNIAEKYGEKAVSPSERRKKLLLHPKKYKLGRTYKTCDLYIF
jgi:cytolysin (calcineurin-like family phosphatase)